MDSIVGTLSQLGKRLRVLTYLGLHEEDRPGDPFLLTSVKGSEDISKPFSFQLDMHRDPNRPYILPSRLVNTPVHFGIRIRSKPYGNEKYPRYIYRTGIVESAEVKFLSQTVKSNVWKYSIDVVPTFKLLEREIVFRVFENMDVRQILKEILADNSYPYLYVDFKGIEAEPFPVLPYCVQFGESTLNFASRLMAQFGIWYYFHNGQIRMGPEPPDLRNGRMVLGKSTPPAEACALPDLKVENLKEEGEIDDEETVAHLMQAVHPTAQWIRSGSFNPLQPTSPISSSAKIAPVLNVLSEPGSLPAEDSSHYRSELFGTPASNNGHAGVLAQARMSGAEACVWTLNGSSKNPTLVAGLTFNTLNGDNDGHPRLRLVNHLEIAAYEFGYEYNVATNIWLAFRNLVRPLTSISGAAQLASNAPAQSLSNWLQNRFPYDMQMLWRNETQHMPASGANQSVPYFDTFVLGGLLATVTSLIPTVESSIEQVIKSEGDDYGNSFQSLYWEKDWPRQLPLPQGTKPLAAGPHLATVIGSKGVDTDGSPPIYADDLGRVRIRFPWQRTLPPQTAATGTDSPGQDTDPLKSDRRTCWVRVSQGWAGRGFGWQFLPRVREEVIVQFLGGDPDQPIVTGRVYNADQGASNLPFPAGQVDVAIYDANDWMRPRPSSDFRFNGLQTNSIPRGKDGLERYHLMRFDDTYGDEQLLLRSQGRMDDTSKGSRYETTEGNRHVLVVPGKDSKGKSHGGGSSFTTVGGEYDLHVGKDRYEKVGGGYQLSVKDKTQLDLQNDCAAVVQGVLSLSADSIVLQAAQKITLKVGGSTIVVDSGGPWLDGPLVPLQQMGSPDSALSVTIKDIADAAKADPGDHANQRAAAPGGKGGPRGQHTVLPPVGITGSLNAGGMLAFDFAALAAEGMAA